MTKCPTTSSQNRITLVDSEATALAGPALRHPAAAQCCWLSGALEVSASGPHRAWLEYVSRLLLALTMLVALCPAAWAARAKFPANKTAQRKIPAAAVRATAPVAAAAVQNGASKPRSSQIASMGAPSALDALTVAFGMPRPAKPMIDEQASMSRIRSKRERVLASHSSGRVGERARKTRQLVGSLSAVKSLTYQFELLRMKNALEASNALP